MTKIVAVVGRPNVGKSTFFNQLAGRRISITYDKPGVTRDRIYADVEWCGSFFTVIDTGGIELKSEDAMWKHIREQANLAVEIADSIIFICDGKEGIMPDDYAIAEILRSTGKPIVLAVNKLDNPWDSPYDFYQLGLGEPFAVSAEHGTGIGDVLDEVVKDLGDCSETDSVEAGLKIAVVGKPNAGKSSLVNKMIGYDRSIVSNIAGTTRDTIDSKFEVNGKRYTIIDTAGIRKKSSVDDDVEYYSVVRAFASIRRADVTLLVIDSESGISEQDVKIAGYIHEQGKPSVIVMNKWDLVEKDTGTMNKFDAKLKETLKFMDYFKSVYVSALTGKRLEKILTVAEEVFGNASRRVPTGILNDVISDIVSVNEPPSKNGRKLKLFYVTQPTALPPTFVFFVNDAKLLHFSYMRYLENGLRNAFDFSGTPIKLEFKNKSDGAVDPK
ncbi:MAG: ribosome biogenesis GTPase Der [Clostridia bacterium]|nr:ribosome biogenesis GTPase Der [Clostridia bacterium]